MTKLRTMSRCWKLVALASYLVWPETPHAATWHVVYDPAEPEDRVGSVAAQAASGDTILIDPGTYYEHIPLEGKSLTFVGVGGAGATILDGSRELPGREGSIIYTLTGAAADLALEGLTLRNGTGAPYAHELDAIAGGAVLWWEEGFMGNSTLRLVDCVFESNTTGGADNVWAAGGGAVCALKLADVRIEQCSFSGNVSFARGGDLYLSLETGRVAQCSFEMAGGSCCGGASIDLAGAGVLTIQECTFESEVSVRSGVGIWGTPLVIEILDCRFIDHGPSLATRIELTDGGFDPRQDILVSRNLFWNSSGADSAAAASLWVAMAKGAYVITENTFVRCGVDIQNNSGSPPPLQFERNIIAGGEAKFFMASGGILECNDFWQTAVTDYIGNLTLSNNITDDPLFCDEEAGDLQIARQSPCAAEHSPAGCGRIGVFDPGCDISATETMSWGRIRALFRGER